MSWERCILRCLKRGANLGALIADGVREGSRLEPVLCGLFNHVKGCQQAEETACWTSMSLDECYCRGKATYAAGSFQ